ncbi:hypothetical protein DSO57_1027602 [Entomophthora muscae]|uniref:Uncharacterized protein n=1 Tax=Entomophthora muscae TaxID=34485 RepID=A0ACC2RGH1_9FUNG|nr:hypothetical protein DSO57_1027602 [Entomophthora muscae]
MFNDITTKRVSLVYDPIYHHNGVSAAILEKVKLVLDTTYEQYISDSKGEDKCKLPHISKPPKDFPALAALPWEETLIILDYLLAWFCPLLKTIRNAQSRDATLMSSKSNEPRMPGLLPSQSGGAAEIKLESSSISGHDQQNFSPSQPDEPLGVM